MDFGSDTFIARLANDSMEPAFSRGDFIYVDPDVPMRPGDFVAVRRGDTTTARQLKDEEGRLVLRTLSPDKQDCLVSAANETTILGVVVFWGRKV